jgi:hypothetical protein
VSAINKWLHDIFSKTTLSNADFHKYQEVGFNFLRENPFSALFLDTGLGKTAILLKLIAWLLGQDNLEPTLVIGPKRVTNVTWPDEIGTWDFSCYLSHTIILDDEMIAAIQKAGQDLRKSLKHAGHSKKVMDALVEQDRINCARRWVLAMMVDRPAHIYLIHQEQVAFLVQAFGKKWPFKNVIIDESSSLKDINTARWKALWKVRGLIKRMHQLTATPSAEGLIYLYPQIKLLDRGERLGDKITPFREKWFTKNEYTRRWAPRDGADEEITAKIADICLVMKQEDYLDLAQPKFVTHPIKLSKKELDRYNQMEEHFVITTDDGEEVEAKNAAELSQKLLQMASGVIYQSVDEEQSDGTLKKRRVVHQLHDQKIEALRQLREELNGENMLVAYYHAASLERILEAFPDAKNMDDQGKLIKVWNSGKLPMLLLHPQANAHGLNLQKGGRHVVFFDMPWSYERYYQLYRRLARQGQKFLTVVHHLVCIGTRDELVLETLKDKGDVQEALFNWLKKQRAAFLKRRKAQQDDEL